MAYIGKTPVIGNFQVCDALLKFCDWVMVSDSPITDKTAWQSYRQELRNITDGLATVDDVNAVVFPNKP